MNGVRAMQAAVSTTPSQVLHPAATDSFSNVGERVRSSSESPSSDTYSTPAVIGAETNRFAVNPQVAAVQQARLFADLSLGDCTLIASLARKRYYRPHEMLFRQGETIQHVCLVTSGIAKITYVGSDGEEVILCLRGPGDLLGVGWRSGRPSESNAAVLERACVLLWDAVTMKNLEARFPMLRYRSFDLLNDDLHEMQQRFRELATEKVALRVARAVVRASSVGQMHRPGMVHITLSREELAQMTGTTVFAVSRLLSEWTKGGIIDAGRRYIVVHNSSKLLQYAARGTPAAA